MAGSLALDRALSLCYKECSLSSRRRVCWKAFNVEEALMGLLELVLIVLVVAAIAGGIGVSPLLWLLLLVALVVFFTGGGFGYRGRGRV
jgi:uncharacterized membrane protein